MATIKNPHTGTVIRPKAHPFAGDAARRRREESKKITDPVTCTINDQEVTVQKGTTIFEACCQAGIYVPHYCYDPDLTIVASCRLCLVEVEKVPKLVPSCSTPVAEGNVILTDSEKVVEARNWQMELLLNNHPLDCPVCDQGGHCQLQRYSMDYGTDDTRFRFPKRVFPKPDLGPLIDIERNRCILCSRCVRFMDEIAGNAELEVMARGNDSYIGTFQEQPLENEFAGNTIDLCPVGCLTDKVFRFRARVWELRPIASVCPHCAVGCSVEIEGRKRNHELLRVTPRRNDEVNGRWICDKGRFGYDFVNSKERAKLPLVKRDGVLKNQNGVNPVDLTVDKLKAIQSEHGGQAIAGLAEANLPNEALYAFQKLLRDALGSNNLDHRTEYAGVNHDDGYLTSLRLGATNDPLDEVEGADAILLIGSDLPNELPILNLKLQQRLKGAHPARLLVAANRGGEYERHASEYIRYRPGTEGAFAAVLLSAVIAAKQADVPGELAALIEKIDVQSCLGQCDLAWDAVEKIASAMANAEHPTILIGEELWSSVDGSNTVAILSDVARVLGILHEDRIGINLLLPESNSRGAVDMGVLPHLGPGLAPVENPGKGTAEILKAAANGEIKALILLGTNLLCRYPDRALAQAALEKTEFVLVIDAFKHETVEMADVFLPISQYSEYEGTFTNVSGRVQRAQAALAPLPGTAIPTRVLQVLAQRLGSDVPEKQPNELFAELASVVASYGQMTWDGILGDGLDQDVSKSGIFAEAGGRFAAFDAPAPPSLGPDGYPLRLIRGRKLWDQSKWVRYTPALVERSEMDGGISVILSPADAQKSGIEDGAEVTVAAPTASLRAKVSINSIAPEGCAVLPGSYDAIAANELCNEGATHVRLTT